MELFVKTIIEGGVPIESKYNFVGEWSPYGRRRTTGSEPNYNFNDVVIYDGNYYLCTKTHYSDAGDPPPNSNFILIPTDISEPTLSERVYVEKQVSVFEDEELELTKSWNDQQVIAGYGSYSKTFHIPCDENNVEIFKYYEQIHGNLIKNITDVNVLPLNPNYFIPARIIQNEIEIKGNLQLQGFTTKEDKKYSFQVLFYGQEKDLITYMEKHPLSKMNDMNTDDLAFQFNYTNVVDTWDTSSDHYVPIMANKRPFNYRDFIEEGNINSIAVDGTTGDLNTEEGVMMSDLNVGYKLQTILDKMFKTFGLTMELSTEVTKFLEELIIFPNSKIDYTQDVSYTTKVYLQPKDDPFFFIPSQGLIYAKYLTLSPVEGSTTGFLPGSGDITSFVGDTYTVPIDGTYTFNVNVKQLSNNLETNNLYFSVVGEDNKIYNKTFKLPGGDFSVTVAELTAGYKIKFYIGYYGIEKWLKNDDVGITLKIQPTTDVVWNYWRTLINFTDISAADFLINFCKTFNIFYIYNDFRKTVNLYFKRELPYSVYDFSRYLQLNKDYSFINEPKYKNINYQFAEGKDINNIAWKTGNDDEIEFDEVSEYTKEYGQYKEKFKYDVGIDKLEFKSIFTVFPKTTLNKTNSLNEIESNTNIVLHSELDESFKPLNTDFLLTYRNLTKLRTAPFNLMSAENGDFTSVRLSSNYGPEGPNGYKLDFNTFPDIIRDNVKTRYKVTMDFVLPSEILYKLKIYDYIIIRNTWYEIVDINVNIKTGYTRITLLTTDVDTTNLITTTTTTTTEAPPTTTTTTTLIVGSATIYINDPYSDPMNMCGLLPYEFPIQPPKGITIYAFGGIQPNTTISLSDVYTDPGLSNHLTDHPDYVANFRWGVSFDSDPVSYTVYISNTQMNTWMDCDMEIGTLIISQVKSGYIVSDACGLSQDEEPVINSATTNTVYFEGTGIPDDNTQLYLDEFLTIPFTYPFDLDWAGIVQEETTYSISVTISELGLKSASNDEICDVYDGLTGTTTTTSTTTTTIAPTTTTTLAPTTTTTTTIIPVLDQYNYTALIYACGDCVTSLPVTFSSPVKLELNKYYWYDNSLFGNIWYIYDYACCSAPLKTYTYGPFTGCTDLQVYCDSGFTTTTTTLAPTTTSTTLPPTTTSTTLPPTTTSTTLPPTTTTTTLAPTTTSTTLAPTTTTTTTSGCVSYLLSGIRSSATSCELACTGSFSTVYGDTNNFSTSTELYSDNSCTPKAPGYYSNGTICRYWNGTTLGSASTCPTTTTTTTIAETVLVNWTSYIEGDITFNIYEDDILQETITTTDSGSFYISNGDTVKAEFTINNCTPYINSVTITQNQTGGGTGAGGACPSALTDFCELVSNGTTMTITMSSLTGSTTTSTTTTTTTLPPTTTTTQASTTTTTTTSAITCDNPVSYTGGEEYPNEITVNLGTTTGCTELRFVPSIKPDRWILIFDSNVVIDTGYWGGDNYNMGGAQRDLFKTSLSGKTDPITLNTYPFSDPSHAADDYPVINITAGDNYAYFNKNTTTQNVYVKVYSPVPETGWTFEVSCPTGSPCV